MRSLRVEIWSDIACPWCWVGKRHLEAAAERFEGELEIVWRAFELDPSAPTVCDPSVTNVERLARKYGVPRQQARQMIDRMTAIGAELGLDFRFDRSQYANTFDAHRLLEHAAEHGRQDALKERLFRAYMTEGRSIANHETLVELATEVGLDSDQVRLVLSTDAYTDVVRDEQRLAQQLGVRGVPFFVIDGRYAIGGAQPPDVLLEALERAAADRHPASHDAESCGPDGCALPS
jgi:predicted DsbA family dithiol-disulfide isomerase